MRSRYIGYSLLALAFGFCLTLDRPVFAESAAQATKPAMSVEDHKAAATLYRQEAKTLEGEAAEYEEKAAAISPSQDPKGTIRNGLITAAQERRSKARDMQALYANHQIQVLTLTGQVAPE